VRGRQLWITAAILALGIAAGGYMLLTNPSDHAEDDGHGHGEARSRDESSTAQARGPHGGRLLAEGDFAVEVTIFEKGGPPEFRAYATLGGKALDPAGVTLQARLTRLGAEPETIDFHAQRDHLRGERPVEEPHSFAVEMLAQHAGRAYRWTYEQFEGRISMNDAAARDAGIGFAVAGPARIRTLRRLQGEIHFNQDRLVRVVPRLDGVVTSAPRVVGDRVRRGDVLAILESQALGDLKSDFLAARQRVSLARTLSDRERRLWEEKITPEQDYLASQQALAEAEITHRNALQKLVALGVAPGSIDATADPNLSRLEIRAPLDGVLIEKHVATGEAVAADTQIYLIADLSTVWAEVTLYPSDLAAVRLGQRVTVRGPDPGARAEGAVSYVGALLGEQTRTAKARITLANPGERWRPGLFVSAELVQNEREVPVAVPVEAIQSLRDRKVVFVRFGDVFEARPVELGGGDGRLVEVASGLAAGQAVAAANSFVLKADLGKAGAAHDH